MANSEQSIHDIVCIRCHQKCHIRAVVEKGKVVKILDAECIKGRTIPDVMYHPDRVLYPLKRAGKRGECKWKRISWDEAITTIANELMEMKEKYGPEALHIKSGSGQKHIGNMALGMANKLFNTPNCHSGSYLCTVPTILGDGLTLGDGLVYENNQDYEHAKCIVFWGADPDPRIPRQAKIAREAISKGTKLIVVDPRPTTMAKRADIWLRIRPGTDAALLLAMLKVIINEGLYDKEFTSKYCMGFDKLKEHVQQYSPEWAAGITWLKEDDIVRAARMYATNGPATLYARLGVAAQQINATQTDRLLDALIGVSGYVDIPGGNLLWKRTFDDAIFQSALHFRGNIKCTAEVEMKRIGAKEYPLMNKGARCDMPLTFKAIEEGKIRALWCVCTNLIVEEPNSRETARLMRDKLDFIFVSDYFMTPTAELADIVLPPAHYAEIDFTSSAFGYPSNYVTASRKVVEPQGECKDDREAVIEIAKKMGVDIAPWETVINFENWKLRYVGVTFDEVWNMPQHRVVFPREFRRYERSNPPFNTPSGKYELYSPTAESLGVEALPIFKEPPESPVRTPELFKEFHLIYVHNTTVNYQHTEGRQIERQRRLAPDPYLEINPETASKLGISNGDWVHLDIPKTKDKHHLTYRAKFVPELDPRVVSGAHGWWFPEKPGAEHGAFDSNINALLSSGPPHDPLVGVPQCRAILCRVWKAESQKGKGDKKNGKRN